MTAQHFIGHSNYSLLFGYLGCFQFSTTVSRAPTNISVHEIFVNFELKMGS